MGIRYREIIFSDISFQLDWVWRNVCIIKTGLSFLVVVWPTFFPNVYLLKSQLRQRIGVSKQWNYSYLLFLIVSWANYDYFIIIYIFNCVGFNNSERTCDKEFIIRRAATNRVLNVLRHWVSKHSQVFWMLQFFSTFLSYKRDVQYFFTLFVYIFILYFSTVLQNC